MRCRHCLSELTGQFAPCRFCLLEEKQLHFVETFLRCRGSIKEVEKALGISYPTVRNMLENALNALDLGDKSSAGGNLARPEEKQEILEQLAKGELSAKEAISALREMNSSKKQYKELEE
ncbi:MAG: DUF2089 domain-containing protein [Firmicutes bacterium]|nr:DUF2089 domain-containing protein [Bacillota bacterium]